MGIEVIFLALALVAVLLTRGSFKKLLTTKLNHWWTLVVVLAGYLILAFAPIGKSQYDTIGLAVLLGTYVFLFGFCAANLNLHGMWIVLVGLATNAIIIGLNKGMPVSTSGGYVVKESVKHQASNSADLLPWLTDVIPLNFASVAISVGDIIFGIGLIVVFVRASRKTRGVEVPDTSEMIETDFEAVPGIVSEPEKTEAKSESDSDSDSEKHPIAVSPSGIIDLEEYDLIVETQTPNPPEGKIASSEKSGKFAHMRRSSQGPGRPRSDEEQSEKAEKTKERRRHKKWQKTHGLAALPSKEELGYDEESMEIVDIAK